MLAIKRVFCVVVCTEKPLTGFVTVRQLAGTELCHSDKIRICHIALFPEIPIQDTDAQLPCMQAADHSTDDDADLPNTPVKFMHRKNNLHILC